MFGDPGARWMLDVEHSSQGLDPLLKPFALV